MSKNADWLSDVRSGNLRALKKSIVDVEANILDETNLEGNTPLHIAARFGHRRMVEEFIKQRPSLALKSNLKGETPVHFAAKAGKHLVLALLIHSMKDYPGIYLARIRDKFGNTPLHCVVRNAHYKALNVLAEKDPESLLWTNDVGESPLSIAIDTNLTKLAKRIITLESSTLNYSGNNGQTLLHCAVLRQNLGIMNMIISLEDGLVSVPDERKRTPLHYAAALGQQGMVEALIKKDSSVAYMKDENKQIPLHLAAENGQVGMIKALIEKCPDTIDKLDNKRQNILHLAAKNGNVDALWYILKLSEIEDLVNSPDKDGNTPLHLAASNYHADVVDALSRNSKVEIRAINNLNQTALQTVTQLDNREMELQMYLTLKALNSAYKQKAINPEEVLENRNSEYQELKHSKSIGRKAEQIATHILSITTIIAGFTFTTAFALPGGLKQDGPDEGMATLISRTAFKAFVITDTIAMTSSITASVILVLSASRRNTESLMDIIPLAIILTFISLIAMTLAFVTGLFVVLQKTLWLAILVCILGCVVPLCFYLFFPTQRLASRWFSRSKTSRSNSKSVDGNNPCLCILRLL